MKAPDVIYCDDDWFNMDSVTREVVPICCDTNKNEGDVEYIRLDKVKELIEAERQVWIEQQKDSEIDLNIVALDIVEGQLEGLGE